jgi:catechol 2,3-dioxygenase-like lactoylglutathione lyase family enzyme
MCAIYGLDHIQLAIPAGGEDKARAFYGAVLGMIEVPKPPALAGRGGVWFTFGACQVHLGVEADFRPARKAHPALLTDDLASLLVRCRAAQIEFGEVQPPVLGYIRAHIFDPFGNRIELLEKTWAP